MSTKRLTLLFSFLILGFAHSQKSYGQQWVWALNASGDNQNDNADHDIVVNHEGTQFIAGYFTDTLKLGAFTLINPDDYYSDMYLAKIDQAGQVIWAKSIELGSTYNDALGICLDDLDNIYVTGANDGKIFVSKYDSSGQLMWNSNIVQKNFYGYGKDIALDQFDNIFITGQVSGSSIVAKLNSKGIFEWSSIVQGCNSNGCWGNDLVVDRLGNCYMAGGFDCDSLVVGNTKLVRSGTWGSNTFLVKYSPEGTINWVKSPNGKTTDIPQVALSDSGYVVLAGSFTSAQLEFDNNNILQSYISSYISSFIAKYDTSGNLIWAKNVYKYEYSPRDIVVDHAGNIYWGGTRFGNWGGSEMDFHLIKFNANGDSIYTTEVLAGHEYLYGLDIDNFGNSYMVGYANVKGMGIFGPGNVHPGTVSVAKFNTGASTIKRPRKPIIQSTFVLCPGNNNVPTLFANGSNIKWYKDKLLKNLISGSPSYHPAIIATDTFYVSQTINGIESWPKQVVVYFSTISDVTITRLKDTLFAPMNVNYTYQWYHDNIAIPDSIGGTLRSIQPSALGLYKVIVNDIGCIKEGSYFFYTDYCPGDTVSFVSNIKGYYIWQVSTDGGLNYISINNDSHYAGANTETLVIKNATSSWRQNKYRCWVNFNSYSATYQILIQTKWTGAINNSWENPGNWSCGVLPDMYTDILIDGKNVILNSGAAVRSVRIINSGSLVVNTGFNLIVVH